MKIKPVIMTTMLLVFVLLSAFILNTWNKHLIFLSNGRIIEADKAWVVFDEVFYEKGEGTLFTVRTDAVDEIVSADFSSFYDWKIIISHQLESMPELTVILKKPMTGYIFLSLFAVIIAGCLWRLIRSKRPGKSDKRQDKEELLSIPISPQAPDLEKIVLYFLNMYLLQIKAKKNDTYQYRKTDVTGPLNTSVYEYRVNIDGQWQSRRMSVGRIGEDSGARSKCFYVIYDDHFVVKIPPDPMTDINEYLNSIRSDRQIADILAPRECLVPKVSIILNRIPSFVSAVGKTAVDSEPKSIHGLNQLPGFQKFLKIGGSFAFYMDLSQYFFLGQILNDCHDAENEVSQEIHKHQELIWNLQGFIDRYGENASDLCIKLEGVYEEFNQQFTASAIASYQKQSWFTGIFLADQSAVVSGKIPGPALAILNKLKISHKDILDEYKNLLTNFAGEKTFKQNIAKIRNISSGLLDLLSWLYFKRIVIRDLKPDNLLVAGDPSKYPHFLNTADDFEIGLIDIEIAVYLNPDYKHPLQPKLGWTPFYATPSHMFVNEVLKTLFDDIHDVFFLQDWYAVTAIIYQAITNEKLFVKTAALLVSFSKELSRYYGDRSQMILFAKRSNETFWQAAAREFESKMLEKEPLLKSLHLDMSRKVKRMFKTAAEKCSHESVQKQLIEINSGITAYDLLDVMFVYIREVMSGKNK